MIYAMLGEKKFGPYKDLVELRHEMFYEGEKHDVMEIINENAKVVATWKKAWIRMDEGVAWHDIKAVDKCKGGV